MENFNIFACDAPHAFDKIAPRSIQLILSDPFITPPKALWDSVSPMSEFVQKGNFHYEKEAYLKIMSALSVSCLEAAQNWDDAYREGIWARIRRALADDGVIVLFAANPQQEKYLKNTTTIPLRYTLHWTREPNPKTLPEHLQSKKPEIYSIMVFSPVLSRAYPEISPYYDALPFFREDGSIHTKELTEAPTIMFCPPCASDVLFHKPEALVTYLIEMFSREGDTVLDFNMYTGIVGKAALLKKRNFIGAESDAARYRTAETVLMNTQRATHTRGFMNRRGRK